MIRSITLLLVCMLMATFCGAESQVMAVPQGKSVMVDGKVSSGEWDDAAVCSFPNGLRVRVKQAGDYVFIAVEPPAGRKGFADLYVAADNTVEDLHASAKLGERRLQSHAWPQWNWWNNEDWSANTAHVLSARDRGFEWPRASEFQIRRTKFHAGTWRIMVEETLQPGDSAQVLRAPEKAVNTDPANWIELQVAPMQLATAPSPGLWRSVSR